MPRCAGDRTGRQSMRLKLTKRFWLKALLIAVGACALYVLLLCFPQPFFQSSVSAANLTLYSDLPFSPDDGRRVLDLARAKLETSPLYRAEQRHTAFICNARWRQRVFFNKDYGAGGVNFYPITSNVFLRDAKVEENLLFSTSGRPVAGDRTLDYFVAHEITHTLTVQAVGWLRYRRLPEWIREGYADYVAKGPTFHYDEARQAFLAGAPEMDREKSGLYWRYHLLVAHLLDKEHWSVQRLLHEPLAQEEVEKAIREENPSQ